MRASSLEKKLQRKFKIRGYNLEVDSVEEILYFISRFEGAEDPAMDLLLDELEKEPLNSFTLDRETVHRVITLLLEAEEATEENPSSVSTGSALNIIDAFSIPRFCYDSIKKVFHECKGRPPIHGDASAKAALYINRYQLLFQRISRHKDFCKSPLETEASHFGSCEISKIHSLVGREGRRRWVMGVISQLEDGHFFLEDDTGSVEINLSSARITTGFFAENTIIVAEGEMHEGNFQIKTCGFPPLEERGESIELLAGIDYFGSGKSAKEETCRLAALEMNAVNDMFVVLSDIWLDSEEKRLWQS